MQSVKHQSGSHAKLKPHKCKPTIDIGGKVQGSTPQTYTIADCLKWYDDKELILNPNFQRGAVWSPQARTYLVDSILRGYPIPKLLIRTSVDRDSRRTIRDVVDGQQRLRTIIDFSSGKLTLGVKSKEFKGLKYSDLEPDQQDAFLAYKLTFEQLLNASDEDVLEVFLRINSYAVPVTEPELRNARFDNDFSDLVKEIVKRSTTLWQLQVISERDRVRMVDQSIVAELLAFLDRGVTDGSESDITRFYSAVRSKSREQLPDAATLNSVIDKCVVLLSDLKGEPIVQRPHFLMLAAAVMYAKDVLPQGKLNFDFKSAPPRKRMLKKDAAAVESLIALNSALASDQEGVRFSVFRDARASTQRMKSRQTRFEYFLRALAGEFSNS
jgi:hypothetical protein